MSTTGLSPESKRRVQIPPKIEEETVPGKKIWRRFVYDFETGNPTSMVVKERDSITQKILSYSKQILSPVNGEVISHTVRYYSKTGRLDSIYEETPFCSSYQKFDTITSIMVYLEEETIDGETVTSVVKRKFDRETGELIDFWGTMYNPETGDPTSALHETFKPETGELTLHEEYKHNPETQELELVQSFVPPLEI